MLASEHTVAWDHPPTRHAWYRHMLMNVLGLVGWAGTCSGLFYVLVVYVAPAFSVFLVPFVLYSFYRTFIQVFYFVWAVRMKFILDQYEWQVLHNTPHGLLRNHAAAMEGPWLEFADPANRSDTIPLVFIQHLRTSWWRRRLASRAAPELKAQINPLWFAGDPRFFAVIAVSAQRGDAPRRLHVLYQRPVYSRRLGAEVGGVSVDDVERARRAGAVIQGA